MTKRNAGGLTDRLLLTPVGAGPEEKISLPEKLLVEKIIVYGEKGFYVYPEVQAGENWITLTPIAEEEGKLTFAGAMITEQIRVRSSGSGTVNEVQVIGSPVTDQTPTVKILWPTDGEELDLISWGTKELRGLVDNPESQIYVNGKKASQNGHYFTVKLPFLGLKPWENNKITVTAVDPQNRESSQELFVSLGKFSDFILDQPAQLVYTDQETFRLSGRVPHPKCQVEVNGAPVPINNRLFSTEAPLVEGLNLIKISFTDQITGFRRAYERQVVKQTGPVRLTIDQPLAQIYTADRRITVAGVVTGVGHLKVMVNNKEAQVNAGYYHLEVPLREGENQITVQAVDQRGATAEREVTVICDTTPPELTEILPEEGFLSSSERVRISGRINDQSPVFVYADGKAALLNEELFTQELTYPDGSSQVRIDAQDLAGNVTTYTINILVDTTPPEPFTVIVDPIGWTNNPQPILTFGATDATSGLSHYELAINNGEFIRVESPYQLSPQPDGEHTVTVKAVDRAGWATTAHTKIYIDTTPPPVPEGFEVISGIDKAMLEWDDPLGEISGYRIQRLPAFTGGDCVDIKRRKDSVIDSYVDHNLISGLSYTYTLYAIDRGGNLSAGTVPLTIIVGNVIAPIENDGGIIRFDDCQVEFDKGTLDESSLVMVKKYEEPLPENEYAAPVSAVYSFTLLDLEGNLLATEFKVPVALTFNYTNFELPAGYSLGDLGVYWFNQEWECWEKIDYDALDIEHQTITVAVNHFLCKTLDIRNGSHYGEKRKR